ncbi:SUKH-4 family immunity protein [Dactylosporangium sp. NPDC049742]|uniref:SUKH-4 family immunity protein n=1 Tax=Dactylosporangium sp. NPDC049742 TaxID=3154737 RepID=UPI00343DB9C5
MATEDLPTPPDFEAVAAWAGAGRVVQATPRDVAAWRLPEIQKAALVSGGIPLIDGVVDAVSFGTEPAMYRLAERRLDMSAIRWVYGAVPETGHVQEVLLPTNETKFVNSSIIHWLCSLHLVGTWLGTSTVIGRWDEDEEAEEAALAELADLLQQIKALDPPAYGDGYHRTHFWPGILDRWLY